MKAKLSIFLTLSIICFVFTLISALLCIFNNLSLYLVLLIGGFGVLFSSIHNFKISKSLNHVDKFLKIFSLTISLFIIITASIKLIP